MDIRQKQKSTASMQKLDFLTRPKLTALCDKPTTGIFIRQMTTEIRSIATKLREIKSIYGFGSAFRSNHYNDIDLLVVFESHKPDAYFEYVRFLKLIDGLTATLGAVFDVTALTAAEAEGKPLHECDRLISLYERVGHSP